MLVNAYVIYNGTTAQYVGDQGVTISINCERLRSYSPRAVWLKRTLAPGDGTIILYEPTFNPTSDELLDPNIVPGMWIEVDGQDTMIDVLNQSVSAFQQACDACCGAVPTIIANQYAGNVTAFSPLALNSLCIYRFDDGSAGAHDAFAFDYTGLFVGSAQLRSNFSGLSHYTIQSYYTLAQFMGIVLLSDVVYPGPCAS
jgi:hypothetical protein